MTRRSQVQSLPPLPSSEGPVFRAFLLSRGQRHLAVLEGRRFEDCRRRAYDNCECQAGQRGWLRSQQAESLGARVLVRVMIGRFPHLPANPTSKPPEPVLHEDVFRGAFRSALFISMPRQEKRGCHSLPKAQIHVGTKRPAARQPGRQAAGPRTVRRRPTERSCR